MFSFSPMCPVILCRHVLFGFSPDELRDTPCIFAYILNVGKFLIWQSRNDYHLRDFSPGANSAVDGGVQMVWLLLLLLVSLICL